MAGKAPLLMALVLFAIGVSGLALTSAERASWGPFEPGAPAATQQVQLIDTGTPFTAPSLDELFTSRIETAIAAEPAPELVADIATPEPTATALPPLKVYGLSADDGGVSAAGVSPTPPPVRIVNVSHDDTTDADDGDEEDVAIGEIGLTATPAPEPEATPAPTLPPAHHDEATPEVTPTPEPVATHTSN